MIERAIKTDDKQRERGKILDGKFPFYAERSSMGEFVQHTFGCHWHPELEFNYVEQGALEFQVNGVSCVVKAGNGIFINTNMLHQGIQMNKEGYCIFQGIRIDATLLGGIVGGNLYSKYVNTILSTPEMSYYYLDKEIEWQNDILQSLCDIVLLFEDKKPCFELDMMCNMFHIWVQLYRNTVHNQHESGLMSRDVERMQMALSYIQQSFQQVITLEDIAASCHMSKSSCSRVFQKILHQSPMEYVISYRITQSLPLLTSDKYSSAEIAEMTGFSNNSYFAKMFLKIIGETPSQYKKRYIDSH